MGSGGRRRGAVATAVVAAAGLGACGGGDDQPAFEGPGFIIEGSWEGDRAAGYPGGDVNGDGLTDIMITRAGLRKYVVFGKDDESPVKLADFTPGVDGLVIDHPAAKGGTNLSSATTSIRPAGDVNGDGYDDILFQGFVEFPWNPEVSLIFGGSDLEAVHADGLSPGDGVSLLQASGLTDHSAIGDLDNDGFDDIALIEQRGESLADVWVIYGGSDFAAFSPFDVLSGDAGFIIRGLEWPRVVPGGDINGDGIDDLVILNSDDWSGAADATIYVVFGGARLDYLDLAPGVDGEPVFDGLTIEVHDLDRPQFVIVHVVTGEDLNGDGKDEVVISVLPQPYGQNAVYVVFGTSSSNSVSVPADLGAGAGYEVVIGPQFRPNAHPLLSPDLDSDSLAELLLQVQVDPQESGPLEDPSPGVYVISGRTDSTPIGVEDAARREGGYLLMDWPEGQYPGQIEGWVQVNGAAGLDLIVANGAASASGAAESGRTYVYFEPGRN